MDKPGDNAPEKGESKGVFVFGGGRSVEIVDYEDGEIKQELTSEMLKKRIASSRKGRATSVFSSPPRNSWSSPTCPRAISVWFAPRGRIRMSWATSSRSFLRLPQRQPQSANTPTRTASVCTKPAGHDGRHSYGQRPAESAGPSPDESTTESSDAPEDIEEPEEEAAESAPTTEDKFIAFFLARQRLSLEEVEAYLRREGKLLCSGRP